MKLNDLDALQAELWDFIDENIDFSKEDDDCIRESLVFLVQESSTFYPDVNQEYIEFRLLVGYSG